MKKLLALLLVLVMVLSMVAWGAKEEAPAATEAPKTEAPAEEKPAEPEVKDVEITVYHYMVQAT